MRAQQYRQHDKYEVYLHIDRHLALHKWSAIMDMGCHNHLESRKHLGSHSCHMSIRRSLPSTCAKGSHRLPNQHPCYLQRRLEHYQIPTAVAALSIVTT